MYLDKHREKIEGKKTGMGKSQKEVVTFGVEINIGACKGA